MSRSETNLLTEKVSAILLLSLLLAGAWPF